MGHGRRAALLAVGLAATLTAGAAAAAQPPETTAAELGLEVTAGYGGRDGGPWLPVAVTLAPSRPLVGTLAVRSRWSQGLSEERVALEVAATSRKVFRFLVPTGSVSVTVAEAGRRPLAVAAGGRAPAGGFLVGVLGALPAQMPPLRSEPTAAGGTWVPVDPAWLELSAASLQPLAALVADASALAQLAPAARRNLAAALAGGTDLVVVADRPGPLQLAGLGPLPAQRSDDLTVVVPAQPGGGPARSSLRTPVSGQPAWQLTVGDAVPGSDSDAVVAAAAPSGRGRVTVVGVGVGDGPLGRSGALWSGLVGPGPRAAGDTAGNEWAVDLVPWQFPRVLVGPESAGPARPWLAAFIAVYVAVVGPVNGLVLARYRRRELAWVTVPVVTAVFTAGGFLGATGGRPPVGLAARAGWWVDGAAGEVVAAGARAPTPRRHRIELPGTGWTVRPLAGGSEPAVVTRGRDTAVELDLPALQLGGVAAWRSAGAPPPLRVDAVAAPGGVDVTVTNVASQPVAGVAVRAATSSRRVGELAPGQSRTVTVGRTRLRRVDPYRDPLEELTASAPGLPAQDAGPPATMEALLRANLLDGNPGLVWAVGTLRGAAPAGVRVDGRPARDAGTLLAVGARPALPAGGAVSAFAVQRDLVDLRPDASLRPGPLALEGATEAYLRFRLPPGGSLPAVHEDLERGLGAGGPFPPGVHAAPLAVPVPPPPDAGGPFPPGPREPLAVPVPPPPGGQAQLTVWDTQARQWLPVDVAFPGGRGDPARLVDPLGELWVRASGALAPFDFSGLAVAGIELDGGGR